MGARATLVLLISATWLCTSCARQPQAPPAQNWNLLLITIDTLRADRLGAYGSSAGATPNLDAIARDGVRFADASAHAPLTLPSHASILTGVLPTEHGLRQNGAGRLPESIPTLATAAKTAGYRTGAFVGAFVLARRFGLDHGFDVYDDEVTASSGSQRFDAERRADRVVDRALAWLTEGPAGPPFFLWVHLFDPHAPYAPPAEWERRFPERPYEAEIAFADDQVGRLRRSIPSRTVVAFAADHGESLGEHGELTHGLLLFQSTLHVPMLIAAPGVLPAGGLVAEPVGLVDLAPTVAGLLGLPGLAGRDLSSGLRTRRDPQPADLYAETEYPVTFGWHGLAALRRGRWKAVAGNRTELFDLSADPDETADRLAVERRLGHELVERIDAKRAAARTSLVSAGGNIDEETRARLAALGYVAPPAASSSRGASRDPRDAVSDFRQFEEAHWDLEAGRAIDAARRLQPLVAADPANAVFRAELGRARQRIGDHQAAVALHREAVALSPRDAQAWYNLGSACQEAQRWGESRNALAEAARLDPEWAEPWNTLGIVALRTNALSEAARHFERSTELDPRSVLAWNNLGNARRALGKLEGAEIAYRRALELSPTAADPANGLGVLLVDSGRPAEAISWFDRALAARPSNAESLLNRGIALELSGDLVAAARDYRAYLAAVRNTPRLAPQRAAIEQRLLRLGH